VDFQAVPAPLLDNVSAHQGQLAALGTPLKEVAQASAQDFVQEISFQAVLAPLQGSVSVHQKYFK